MKHSPDPQNYVSHDRQKTFLRFLRIHLLNVTAACRSAGLAGTAGVYLQRRRDDDFRKQWEQIEEEVLDEAESGQWRAAQEDSVDRRWTLNRRRPGRWRDSRQIASQTAAEPPGDVVQMSDEDLIQIASCETDRGNQPEGIADADL